MTLQALIRDVRMRLQYAAGVRRRSTETRPEFARRKAAAIERHMDEAGRVAEMWEGV